MVRTLWDSITEFLSPEAGQRRTQALQEFGRDVEYYVPPELRGLLGFAAEMTPTASLERASQASGEMLAPGRTPMERVGSAGRMLSETAGVAAPMAVAPRAGMTAAQALQEALLGASVAGQGAADAARRFALDEAGSVGRGAPLPAPRNDAEAMARDILEMRAAGRAGDVTDEMMAAADPQYMFANTPLPMDYESRMRRAISQGFDVNDEMYRGDAPRQSFETGRSQRDKIGVTMSTRPDVAASYIPPRGEGGIYPLVSRGQSDAVIEAGGQNWNVIMPDTPVSFQGEQSLLSDYLPVEDYFEPYDVIGGTAFFDTNDLSRIYQGYGADRIRFNDLVDRGGSAKYYGPESSMPSDVQMVADPRNVRSRFARFDPEFRHLRNLSAGVAGGGLLATQPTEQEREEEIRQYLGGLL